MADNVERINTCDGKLFALDLNNGSSKMIVENSGMTTTIKLAWDDTAINTCDGKLMALDLKTGESKTIVEDSGMTIYPLYAWDDIVLFAGWAYTASGEENADGNRNLLMAYASGEPYKIWGHKGKMGRLSEEYLASIREVTKAVREAYEAKQNEN